MDPPAPEGQRPTKKRRRNSGIRRNSKGGKSKTHRAAAASSASPPAMGDSVGGGCDPLVAKRKQIKSLLAKDRRTAISLAKGMEKVVTLKGVVDTLQQQVENHAHLDKKRDAREAELVASEAKARTLLDKRTQRFSSSQMKKDTENKELNANLKTELAEVATVWEENKAAVKEVKEKVWEEKKSAVKELKEKVREEKKAAVKEVKEKEVKEKEVKEKEVKEKEKIKASVLPFTF